MKKIILLLSLSVFTLSAYANNGENALLALKGKDAFTYEKLYRGNLVVYNCAKDANAATKQSSTAEPERCQQHYNDMINSINKDLGIPGVTAKDIQSDKVNEHISLEANKYMNQHLQEFMDNKNLNSEHLNKFVNVKNQNS